MFELFGTGHRGPPHGGTTPLLISTATDLIAVVMMVILPLMYVSTELPPVCDRTESDSVASNSGVSGASCRGYRVLSKYNGHRRSGRRTSRDCRVVHQRDAALQNRMRRELNARPR